MVRRHLAITLLASLALAGAANADELADGFSEADQNGDGGLDVDEYLAAVVTAFAARDTNGNRLLTAAELPEASRQDLARIDRDGDGRISVGEAAGDRIVRFFDADANNNGLLTLAELRGYIDSLDRGASR